MGQDTLQPKAVSPEVLRRILKEIDKKMEKFDRDARRRALASVEDAKKFFVY